ncbi:MAG: hypothetical protein HYX47_09580 [Burkholderiales bacterium]|nr:hypothetical protein [Burkholderiales bacterium]
MNEAAAARAAHVLDVLVFGEVQPVEPVSTLNRLLCGMQLDSVVSGPSQVCAAEKETLDGLLHAVSAHWAALGETSADGLRQTFLQREGELVHGGGGWTLRVPQKTFDMLLDRLPWSIAICMFPWMAEPLHVNWRAGESKP